MNERVAPKISPRRWVFRIAILLCLLALLPLAFRDFNPLPQDFIAYWAAGRLNASGGNPYSPSAMLAVQQTAGWADGQPLMVWYPPWVLPLFMPFGALPFKLGWLTWYGLVFGLLLYCADWFWRRYGGPLRLRWLAGLSVLLTSYTLFNLTYTQATPLMLLGLALFLNAISSQPSPRGWAGVGWGVMLGAGLLLVSIKPQLLVLFWLLLGIWVLKEKRLDILLAGGLVFLAFAALTTIFNPGVWGEYLGVLQAYPPDFWATPTLGFLLRQVFGWDKFWIQFPGVLLGLGWAAWYWRRYQPWDWASALPAILLVSLVTASHTWTHDQILLIPAQIAVTAGLLRVEWSPAATRLAVAWGALQGLSFLLHFWVSDAWFFWQAPAVGVLYLAGMHIGAGSAARR